MDDAIRAAGAVPAWVGVVDGSVIVGLSVEQLARFADPDAGATKVARRDYPVAVASGALGATTVSATIWAAARAGIEVGVTGGIGGVHPGADRGRGADVSADLLELARTPGVLVCSGPKSIIDPVATAERLDELGVAVVGFGVDRLPFFLARRAPVDLGIAPTARPGRGAGGTAPRGPRRELRPPALQPRPIRRGHGR